MHTWYAPSNRWHGIRRINKQILREKENNKKWKYVRSAGFLCLLPSVRNGDREAIVLQCSLKQNPIVNIRTLRICAGADRVIKTNSFGIQLRDFAPSI